MTPENIKVALITSLSLCAFALLWFYVRKQQHAKQAETASRGLSQIQHLRTLLMLMQQHRGISNGFLNGDATLKSRMISTTDLLNKGMSAINMSAEKVLVQRWLSIQAHWHKLSTSVTHLTPANSLQQHNKLILNLLYCIEDTHEKYDIANRLKATHQSTWLQLLFTTESIGQIRAIGTGVAASKQCSSVERIRLNYLCHSVQEKINNKQIMIHVDKVEALLASVENQLLQAHTTIGADSFFANASQCIELFYAEFDLQLATLEKGISSLNKNSNQIQIIQPT